MTSELLQACIVDDTELALALIKSGGPVNERLKDNPGWTEGNTPLLVSIWRGNKSIVECLLEREDLEINSQDSQGRSALMNCLFQKRQEFVKPLLEKGIDVNLVLINGETALMLAIKNNMQEISEILLNTKKVNLNYSYEGRTALTYACMFNNTPIALRLIKEGININVEMTNDNSGFPKGSKALDIAMMKKNQEIIKELLIHKDNINKIPEGKLITYLCQFDVTELALELINKSDDVNTPSDISINDQSSTQRPAETPLLAAIRNNNQQLIDALLSHKSININYCTDKNYNALIYCCIYCNQETAIKLINKNINIYVKLKSNHDPTYIEGDWALTISAWNGLIEIVKLLLQQKDINVNDGDRTGNSPFYNACRRNHQNVAILLLKHGAIITHTALDQAISHKMNDLISMMFDTLVISLNILKKLIESNLDKTVIYSILNKKHLDECIVNEIMTLSVMRNDFKLYETIKSYKPELTEELITTLHLHETSDFITKLDTGEQKLMSDKLLHIFKRNTSTTAENTTNATNTTNTTDPQILITILKKQKNIQNSLSKEEIINLYDKVLQKSKEESGTCIICRDAKIDTAFTSCWHVSCNGCYKKLNDKCPVCTKKITGTQRFFI